MVLCGAAQQACDELCLVCKHGRYEACACKTTIINCKMDPIATLAHRKTTRIAQLSCRAAAPPLRFRATKLRNDATT
eukprot:4527043-Lingulodinium_polyedra.AAC.1